MKKNWMNGLVGSAWLAAIVGLLVLSSCLPDADPLTPEEALDDQISAVNKVQLQSDLKIIDDSLAKWGITALKEPRGVRYVVETEGTGAKPTLSNVVVAKYTGRILKTGATFAPTDTITINLYDLIIGWQTTVPLVGEGSKLTLYIPSGFGYGTVDVVNNTNGTVLIPRNSNLIFDIELLDVR